MIWSEIGSQNGQNAVVYSLLFGILMAMLVYNLRKHGMLRRGKSLNSTLLVIMGVAGTVACGVLANVITIETLLWLLLCFGASGLPMAVESWYSDHQAEIEEVLK